MLTARLQNFLSQQWHFPNLQGACTEEPKSTSKSLPWVLHLIIFTPLPPAPAQLKTQLPDGLAHGLCSLPQDTTAAIFTGNLLPGSDTVHSPWATPWLSHPETWLSPSFLHSLKHLLLCHKTHHKLKWNMTIIISFLSCHQITKQGERAGTSLHCLQLWQRESTRGWGYGRPQISVTLVPDHKVPHYTSVTSGAT